MDAGMLICSPEMVQMLEEAVATFGIGMIVIRTSTLLEEGQVLYIDPSAAFNPHDSVYPVPPPALDLHWQEVPSCEETDPLPLGLRTLYRTALQRLAQERSIFATIAEARRLTSADDEDLDPHLGGDDDIWRRTPDVNYARELETAMEKGEQLTLAEVLAKWKGKGNGADLR